jgi:hypothetical protein
MKRILLSRIHNELLNCENRVWLNQLETRSMIKIIQSQDPTIKPKTIGYIRNMSQYKQLRILLRILLVLCIVTIPVLILWFIYEKLTKRSYLTGRYLILSKNKYPLDKSIIRIEELNNEDGNTLLGTVAGGVLFGGLGALGGAILGSRKSGAFVLTDQNNKKTLIEAKGTGIVKQLREYSLSNQVFGS